MMISYETILAATQGEPLAILEVLAAFDHLIDSLCTSPYVEGGGRVRYEVDTQMKTELQGKLIQAILRFKA